jgi:hypothetical protein
MTVGKNKELGSYPERMARQNTIPMIDDVTYNMLMGVAERFVLCKCLS